MSEATEARPLKWPVLMAALLGGASMYQAAGRAGVISSFRAPGARKLAGISRSSSASATAGEA